MNYLRVKNKLERMDDQKVASLVKYYGINEPDNSDRLWKLALHITTQKRPKNYGDGTRSYIYHENVAGVKEYHTHDNGGRPFLVKVDDDGIHIYTHDSDNSTGLRAVLNGSEMSNPEYNKLVDTIIDYQGYWWGYDPNDPKLHGNSILIDVNDNEYIFIGDNIYRFKTDDVIKDYVSPVGNNDVPYPVAYGQDNVYFMLDQVYIPREKLNTVADLEHSEDMYREFYGHMDANFKPKDVKKMKDIKVLSKRKL